MSIIDFKKIISLVLQPLRVYAIIMGTLLLLAGCQSESFEKPDSPLTNTYWKLNSLNGNAITTYEGNREMFLQFRGEGLRGFGGCNKFNGGYSNTESTISFQPIASTRMLCQNSSQQEALYLGLLMGSVNYEINGESMRFTTAKNKEIATFSAIYF